MGGWVGDWVNGWVGDWVGERSKSVLPLVDKAI